MLARIGVMRLLSEHMSVPEVRATMRASLVSAEKNTITPDKAAVKDVDVIENRNLQLARKVEEFKTNLIQLLSKFPATAVWLMAKYEQSFSKDDVEEEPNQANELNDYLRAINTRYEQLLHTARPKNVTDIQNDRAKIRLTEALQQFPFAFDDLVGLVDVIISEAKRRGLECKLCMDEDAKLTRILAKRLENNVIPKKSGNISPSDLFNLAKSNDSFLFGESEDLVALVKSSVMAEHYWLFNRQQLASANVKLVLFIANQYKGNFLDFEDLVQEGHSGLLKAVDRFKHRLGFQFSTYAGYWIRQAISRALSRSERVVRIPCGQIATINKVYRAKDELTLKTGKEPDAKQLAEHTGLTLDEVNNVVTISQTAVALESFDDDEDEQAFSPIDYLEQNVFSHSAAEIAESQLTGLMSDAIKTLNAREAKIITTHFGVGTDDQKTLQEIGSELNLTRERVRQIQVVALNKIRQRYGEQLASFLY
jgi:RNA polymerase sigma factor (sigma-70 family)